MKVQDLAYRVASRTVQLLEEKQHYKVSDEHRKEVLTQVLEELDSLIKSVSCGILGTKERRS